MNVKKRKTALAVAVIMSMVMAAFVSVRVPETGRIKVYAATDGKLEIVFQQKKLVVGMSKYPQVKKGSKTLSRGDMTWKSSNKKVAVVNSVGTVTAKKAGTVTITAVNKNNKKQKATCKLVVAKSISGTYKKTKWKLSKGGVLEVKGSGNMYAKEKMPPWYKYRDFVKSAKIEVKGVTNLSRLFLGCYSLESVNLSKLDTSKVTDMSYMFGDTEGTKYAGGGVSPNYLEKLDVSGFDTSKVKNMNNMFSACIHVKNLDVSEFDTSKVTDMHQMFSNCNELKKLDVSGFDTSKVTDMHQMFDGCRELKNLDVSGFDTSKVTNMHEMFDHCTELKNLNVSGFDTSKVKDMGQMFDGCRELKNLDLSSFDISNVKTISYAFRGCKGLITIHTPKQSATLVPQLPEGTWTDGSGQNYTTLPANATGSAVLVKVVES